MIESFSFEIYHLIESLMFTHYDSRVDQQTITDVESAMGIFEQILLNAPEFVGKGWQQNGIEFLLKMLLHPKNVLAVRKLAIRLFIIWYQILAIFNRTTHELDIIFQCCLPFFPLRNGQSTEEILTINCEGIDVNDGSYNNGNGNVMPSLSFEPCSAKSVPMVVNLNFEQQQTETLEATVQTIPDKANIRERAQTLQIYLDKFLEYTTRETIKICWSNPSQRLDCAKLLLERIIIFYIYELFPDIESDGIDVYEGWEGTYEAKDVSFFDTAEPTIIAKYWLIRWMTNIAIDPSSQNKAINKQNGLQLFKKALFQSRKATNILLNLIREAFFLPLSCINVMQKVLQLLHLWLTQQDCPNFVDSHQLIVSPDSWNLLLIHMLFSFFRSYYLNSPGDKLSSAISITNSILQIVRNIANPTTTLLIRPFSKTVWQELIRELISSVEFSTRRSDAFGQATTAGFTRTLLSVLIFLRVIREIDLDEWVWDDVLMVFRGAFWTNQIMEQWSRIVLNMTRALILNIFSIEINTQKTGIGNGESQQSIVIFDTKSSDGSYGCQPTISRAEHSSDSGSVRAYLNETGVENDSEERVAVSSTGDNEMQESTGNAIVWLRSWMRVISLVDSIGTEMRHSQIAVQTFGLAIDMLIQAGCANSIIHWLTTHILRMDVAKQPHAIHILFNVLNLAHPPFIERSYILYHLLDCLRTDDVAQLVLEHFPSMKTLEDMSVISSETILTLQKLVQNREFSSRAIRVAALLSLNHPEAEKILLSLLEQRHFQIDQTSLTLCINAISLLILERADASLFDHLLKLLVNHQYASRILPIFCANVGLIVLLGFHSQLIDSLLLAQSKVKCVNALNDLKWQFCSITSRESISPYWRILSDNFTSAKDDFLEGFVIRLSGQYPLPGFPITQWNSLPNQEHQEKQQQSMQSEEAYNNIYIETEGSFLSFDRNNQQTLWSRNFLGKQAYQIESLSFEEEGNFSVDQWLKILATSENAAFQFTTSARKKSSPVDDIFDPFQELPYPTIRSYASSFPSASASVPHNADLIPLDISVPEMLQFIQNSSRSLQENDQIENTTYQEDVDNDKYSWLQFIASFGMLDMTRNAPNNFQREIRHLDTTTCREVHKVAVIYVGKDQQNKQVILSNNSGSDEFNKFVDGLGWSVHIGSPEFFGYTGGLPNGQMAPYYSTANTEIIFHVSTLLNGDMTQRLKHLGNDEVHVVWTEDSKPYRRDLIATRFCDVLIVLYVVSPVLLRVHIEAQDERIQFGPLFDGSCIHILQAASLVRETALNASRAYRNLRLECDRPNKHREKVFSQTKQKLTHMPLSASITHLYTPCDTLNL